MPERGVDIRVRMNGARRAQRESDQVGKSIRGIGKDSDYAARRMRAASGVGRKFMGAMTAAAIAGAGAIAFGIKGAITAASDLNEEINKTSVIFGSSSRDMLDWSKSAATAMGMSRQQALSAAGQFGNVFTTLGIGQKDAAGMSKKMIQLAADMASFNNASPEDTLAAIQGGLRGEFDPMEKYVAGINAAAVQQEALSQTHKKTAKDLTAQDKALAFQALLFKSTTKQQGDFARTSNGLANQQRTLKAQWTDLQAVLGKALLPYISKVVGWLSKFVTGIRDNTGAGGKFASKVKQVGEFVNTYLIKPLTAAVNWIRASHDRMTALAIGLGVITAALIAFAIAEALAAAPITLIIVGIGLLAAGLYYAYQRVGWFRDAVNWTWGVLKAVGTWIAGAGVDAWGALKTAIGAVGDAFDFIKGAPEMVKGVFTSVLNWVIDRINDIIGFMNKAIDLYNKVPLAPDIGHIGTIGHIGGDTTGANTAAYRGSGAGATQAVTGHMAAGGMVRRSGVYEVGERGRERVWLPQGAAVQPAGGVPPILEAHLYMVTDGKITAKQVHRQAVKAKSTR